MRHPWLSVALALVVGSWLTASCTHEPKMPEQLIDDPSARTTTVISPPSTPEEMAKQCDVQIYPKAKAPDGMSRMPRVVDGKMHYDLVLTTSDSAKKVADFYSKEIKDPATKSPQGYTVMGRTVHGNEVIVQVESEGGQTVVRIKAIGK